MLLMNFQWAGGHLKNTFFDKILKHYKAEGSEIVSSCKKKKKIIIWNNWMFYYIPVGRWAAQNLHVYELVKYFEAKSCEMVCSSKKWK